MKIYKDIFTGEEMLSDGHKIELVDDVVYEVYGKFIEINNGDVQIDGFDPYTEKADGRTDERVEAGVDVVLHSRLQETFAFQDAESYRIYLENYRKRLENKLKETDPKQVEVFKTNIDKVMKDILNRFKEFKFFVGESMDINGLVIPMEYRKIDGKFTPVLMFFKHALEEESFE